MKLILADEFIKLAVAAGIVPHNCRRMVIDAEAGAPVKILYEVFADERLLKTDVFAGITIRDDHGVFVEHTRRQQEKEGR